MTFIQSLYTYGSLLYTFKILQSPLKKQLWYNPSALNPLPRRREKLHPAKERPAFLFVPCRVLSPFLDNYLPGMTLRFGITGKLEYKESFIESACAGGIINICKAIINIIILFKLFVSLPHIITQPMVCHPKLGTLLHTTESFKIPFQIFVIILFHHLVQNQSRSPSLNC